MGRDKASGKDIYLSISICKHARLRVPMIYVYNSTRYRMLFARNVRKARRSLSVNIRDMKHRMHRYYYYYSRYHKLLFNRNTYIWSYIHMHAHHMWQLWMRAIFFQSTAITTLMYFSVFSVIKYQTKFLQAKSWTAERKSKRYSIVVSYIIALSSLAFK